MKSSINSRFSGSIRGKIQADKAIENLVKFLETPEGKQKVQESFKKAEEFKKRLAESRRIDYDIWTRPCR